RGDSRHRQSRCDQCGIARGGHTRKQVSGNSRRAQKMSDVANPTSSGRSQSCKISRSRICAQEGKTQVTIGILGGGQLGYMLALAGYPLDFHFRFLDPSPQAPVGRIAPRVTAEYSDFDALEKFAHGLALVTYEFENVPVEAARFLQKMLPVYPPPQALEAAQDRLNEKALFQKLGIPTTEFAAVNSTAELDRAIGKLGLPGVLKTRRLGYDGKGQWVL